MTIRTTSSKGRLSFLQKQDIQIDVVLSDIEMRGSMNGFGFAQRARSVRPDLQIVLAGSPERTTNVAADLCEDGPMLTRPRPKLVQTSNSTDVKPGKRERDYRFLDAEEPVERLDGDGTRKLVRGPDGWLLGAAVRCSNRFHLRCKSRCRSRGYWRVFGTGIFHFRMIQKPCQRRIVPPALR
jgi:CheY-like chemotaxis protein